MKKVPGSIKRVLRCNVDFGADSADATTSTDAGEVTEDLEVAQLATSALAWRRQSGDSPGLHAPVLDIDVPCTYVPSSTPGHGHLYIDVPMTWENYVYLMRAMAEVGILEPGYVSASVDRGFSGVRLPWIKKLPDA